MIASLTVEDYFDLTDGTNDSRSEAELFEEQSCLRSLFATELGGEMEEQVLTADEVGAKMVGDGDGDDGCFAWDTEEIEDLVSRLDGMDRVVVAGNALAGLTDEQGLLVVLEWLCKVGPTARGVVAKEAAALVANRFLKAQRGNEPSELNQAHAAVCELLAVVSPSAFGGALRAE